MKNYVKPVLYFESFELTQHIAGNCELKLNATENACVASFIPDKTTGAISGVTIYNVDGCLVGPDKYDGFCYYGSANGFNLTNS